MKAYIQTQQIKSTTHTLFYYQVKSTTHRLYMPRKNKHVYSSPQHTHFYVIYMLILELNALLAPLFYHILNFSPPILFFRKFRQKILIPQF